MENPASPSSGQAPTPAVTPRELEHLKQLSMFHYIVGGITFLFSSFPLIHVAIGLMIATGTMGNEHHDGRGAPPAAFGLIFAMFGCAFVAAGWTVAVSMIAAGRFIAARRRHTFCTVVAAVSCIFMPFGTVLGVLTLLTLSKPQVKALFASTPKPQPS